MKTDYNKIFEEEIEEIKKSFSQASSGRPSLLLHACCGPCSSATLEKLSDVFDVTVYFYNPNIHPEKEYFRRLEELKRFAREFPPAVSAKVSVIEEKYDPKEYFDATKVELEPELKAEKEMGERCRRCYQFRMEKAWDYAQKSGFDYFTTTLSISPHKDSKKINEIGKSLESGLENPCPPQNASSTQNASATPNAPDSENPCIPANAHNSKNAHSTKYLYSDFKKKNGFLRSLQLSDQYGLYRQDYCGCVFSMRKD